MTLYFFYFHKWLNSQKYFLAIKFEMFPFLVEQFAYMLY